MTRSRITRANQLIRAAIRADESAIDAFQRQKCNDSREEKFDCNERARRFDLIRSLWLATLLPALFRTLDASLADTSKHRRATECDP